MLPAAELWGRVVTQCSSFCLAIEAFLCVCALRYLPSLCYCPFLNLRFVWVVWRWAGLWSKCYDFVPDHFSLKQLSVSLVVTEKTHLWLNQIDTFFFKAFFVPWKPLSIVHCLVAFICVCILFFILEQLKVSDDYQKYQWLDVFSAKSQKPNLIKYKFSFSLKAKRKVRKAFILSFDRFAFFSLFILDLHCVWVMAFCF